MGPDSFGLGEDMGKKGFKEFDDVMKALGMVNAMVRFQGIEKTLEDLKSVCESFDVGVDNVEQEKCTKTWECLMELAELKNTEDKIKGDWNDSV